MLERYLIDHCSPTLASLKTANMFSCPYESGESLEEDVHKWNLQMKDKGLYLQILRKNDKKALGIGLGLAIGCGLAAAAGRAAM